MYLHLFYPFFYAVVGLMNFSSPLASWYIFHFSCIILEKQMLTSVCFSPGQYVFISIINLIIISFPNVMPWTNYSSFRLSLWICLDLSRIMRFFGLDFSFLLLFRIQLEGFLSILVTISIREQSKKVILARPHYYSFLYYLNYDYKCCFN